MTVWLTCRKDSHVPVRYQRKKSTAGKRPIMKKSWKVVSVKTLVSNQFSASFNTEKAILFVTWWQFFRSLKFLIFFQPSISFFFPKISHIRLIYITAEDGINPEDFHRCCDGVLGTLTLIRSKNERIARRYTDLDWEVDEFKSSRRSYFFSVDNKRKYDILLKDKLV